MIPKSFWTPMLAAGKFKKTKQSPILSSSTVLGKFVATIAPLLTDLQIPLQQLGKHWCRGLQPHVSNLLVSYGSRASISHLPKIQMSFSHSIVQSRATGGNGWRHCACARTACAPQVREVDGGALAGGLGDDRPNWRVVGGREGSHTPRIFHPFLDQTLHFPLFGPTLVIQMVYVDQAVTHGDQAV